MKKIIGTPFWVRASLLFGGMASIGVLALGVTQTYRSREADLAARHAILSVRASETRNELAGYLGNVRRIGIAISSLPWGEKGWLNEKDLNEELDRALQLVPQAAAVYVCDGTGKILALRERNRLVYAGGTFSCGKSQSMALVESNRTDEDGPMARVSVESLEFGRGGLLVFQIDIRALANLLRGVLEPVEGIERIVVDGSAHAILHNDPLQVLQGGQLFSAGELNQKGWLTSTVSLPNSDWVVLAAQRRDEIDGELRRNTLLVLATLVLIWLAVVAVSIWVARRVTRPVSDIVLAVESFAQGHLNARVKIKTSDEIGVLARRFNGMADVIQRSQENLEEQVAARTSELASANTELSEWSRELERRVNEKLREVERLSELKRFFSPRLAESLVAEDRAQLLQSHRREATVMFVDLRGFTAFAEAAPAERVMAVLREFHAEAGRLIFEFEGTLERFTGDGMMVFFNDPDPMPDHAGRAVALACRLRDRAAALMQSWQSEGAGPSGVGIGLSLGQATIGPIGFESRVDYAAIGTVTNRAARLCAEAAAGEVLICSALHERLQGRLHLAGTRQAQFKGLQALETCYAVAAIDAAPADPLLTNAPAAAG